MRIIDQFAEVCNTNGYTLQDIYKDIERAARVSYKSENKITEGSAEKMVQRLINMKHYSPLEFGTVYLTTDDYYIADKYVHNKYSKVAIIDHIAYITTNYRVIVENRYEDHLKYLTLPTIFHSKRVTVHFITNRAVSHELVRHRSMSFMQESQRYCNYSKGKFNNELTFIRPAWDANGSIESYYADIFTSIEDKYMHLIKNGWTPQQARMILPNATKTELYMCGFEDDWEHFFSLRDKDSVDPQMYALMHPLHEDYIAYIDKTEGNLIEPEIAKQLKSVYP